MQAIVFPQLETIALERVADPTPAADEVVVRVARCGICGTDVHIYRNEYMSTFPLIPGHEFGGTVVEGGPGDQALIFGAGPMGLLLLQALRHSGASQVVMVEK